MGIGKNALLALTDGDGCTAIGFQALATSTTGEKNTAVGYNAMTALPAGGNKNTAIGYSAGSAMNNASADFNTIVGSEAASTLTTGNKNTIIGQAADCAAGRTNAVAIGNATTAVADNSVTLGDGDVDAVYMASDSGATIYAAGLVEGSSLEIKKNISEIESPLDKITKLRGIEFDYKETNEHSIGMVAEEVNEIFPELVSKDEDGKVTAMSYSRMTAVLLEAVKELSQEVKELKMNNIYNNKERD